MAEEALNLPMNTFVNLPFCVEYQEPVLMGFMAGRPAVRQNTENLKFTAYWIGIVIRSVINAFQSVFVYCKAYVIGSAKTSRVHTKIEFHFIA